MTNSHTFYRRYGKRLLDLALAIPVALLLGPVVIVVAVLVRWRLGTPVLFRQPRAGFQNRAFTLNKFRSMLDAVDKHGEPLPDEVRLTRFGKLLRSLSLDELPQLWNVLRGDMSLIGPRPLLVEYVPRYNAQQRRRHEVLPGITGWAQVNGRNAISWEDKFAYDVWYVDHLSLGLDLRILWKTVMRVVAAKDVNADQHATMPKFMGSELPEQTSQPPRQPSP
jgi:lipopolysaccharide/colanic/teichoic acid biosynthesis glycosyltransferase